MTRVLIACESARVLTIPVKGEYFDQIAAGDKLYEYRLMTPYWVKRLKREPFSTVVLTRGYPKAGGVEGVTRLTREWRYCAVRTITHPHFGPDPVNVFAIDVSVPHPQGVK
jgi:hypothetical protein